VAEKEGQISSIKRAQAGRGVRENATRTLEQKGSDLGGKSSINHLKRKAGLQKRSKKTKGVTGRIEGSAGRKEGCVGGTGRWGAWRVGWGLQ